jgi:hypothetical protein
VPCNQAAYTGETLHGRTVCGWHPLVAAFNDDDGDGGCGDDNGNDDDSNDGANDDDVIATGSVIVGAERCRCGCGSDI